MKRLVDSTASFNAVSADKSQVSGSLDFATVSKLLPLGTAAIDAGCGVIDLAGVTDSDSSGLALLIEWMSLARASGHELVYHNMPVQLHQLARLSEVEGLISVPT